MTAALKLIQGNFGNHGGLTTLERWELAMRARGLSDRTIKHGLATVQHMATFNGKTIEECTVLDVQRFLGRPHLKHATKCSYYGVIRLFYKWWGLESDGFDAMARMQAPKWKKGLPRPLTPDEVQRLLSTTMRTKTRAMLMLGLYAGLRVSEIGAFSSSSIVGQTIRVLGKGGTVDLVPLHPELAELARTMPVAGPWFPGNNRSPNAMHGKEVSRTIKMLFDRAGIEATPHALRHTYATSLLDAGVDIRVVQTLMRHQNIANTAIYTRVSNEGRAEAIARLDFSPKRTRDR